MYISIINSQRIKNTKWSHTCRLNKTLKYTKYMLNVNIFYRLSPEENC